MIDKSFEKNFKIIISAIRFAGILIFTFGLALIFDLGGIAGKMDMTDNKMIGMGFAIMGIVEFILTPRIFEIALKKNKK